MKNANGGRLEAELRHKIRGEVYFDEVTRHLYSTDASLFEIQPVGVVVARDKGDIIQCLRTAAKYGVSILPRGGGTSLAGQAVGRSLVVDYSKYMTALLELNLEEKWVRVEPGVVRDELNEILKPHGLQFTPDVATSNRATIGGMIANNAAGARSIVYGRTIDQVLELDAVLANGEEVVFRELSEEQYQQKCQQQDLEGQIYREVRRVVRENADEIRARFPKVQRRAGGYNLDLMLAQESWNLAKLVTGCEGTLAFVTAAKVKIDKLPKATGLVVACFHDLFEALRATVPILDHRPAAVELLDNVIMGLATRNLEIRKSLTFVSGTPGALFIVEFHGETPAEVTDKIAALEQVLQRDLRCYACSRALRSEEQNQIWNVRKAGLGLMLSMKGDFKPLPFIEDAAVPVEHLPEYIQEVVDLIHRHQREVSMYAHASIGLLHVRPILNLKQPEDFKIMRSISEGVLDLVMKYGGMMSGEHGDGLVRSFHNERFFGPRLYQAFREIKRAFDPGNLMNPGKIVDAQSIEENHRLHPGYQVRQMYTHFHYAEDGGFDRAVEMCTGVGACRKTLTGTMCPSYMATRDEEHSTRGRANALRAAMTGKFSTEHFTSKRLYEVFELCLSCKGCKSECPSNVDVAKLKYEFLAHYYEEHGTPLPILLFSRPDLLGMLAMPVAGLVNRTLQSNAVRGMLQFLFGIDRRRQLPLYARENFVRWFKRRHADGEAVDRPPVVLFNDTFMNYHEPEIGIAAVRVLEALGYRVILAEAGCCGRAQISNGLLRAARPHAEALVDRLAQFAEQGIPVVGCEPGCASAIKEDYLDFVRQVDTARKVADNFFLIEEFILREEHRPRFASIFQPLAQELLYHGHCHLKSLFGTASSTGALTQVAGCKVTEVDSGCCGMAGAFGYEKKHYDLSLKVGARRLFPAIEALPPEHGIVANGFSCRHQIAHATGRRARHAIEVLAEALR